MDKIFKFDLSNSDGGALKLARKLLNVVLKNKNSE